MTTNKKSINKGTQTGKSKRNLIIIFGLTIMLIVTFFLTRGGSTGDGNTASAGSDLIIPKSEITETAKFFPVKVGKTNMEVMAVKASDGTIRTAFNTCQVCNGSPRAYYKQQGNVVICQNCGNKFSMDMIEQQRGGCNPIPIMKDEKTDDGTNIIISKAFIEQNKGLFTDNWKTK